MLGITSTIQFGIQVDGEIRLGELLVALGTGALAVFTWLLARKTAATVRESHSLGETALKDLRVATRQRIDAVAPAVEAAVGWLGLIATSRPVREEFSTWTTAPAVS